MKTSVAVILTVFLPVASDASQIPVTWVDPSRHAQRFVQVETGVQVEILDWGGSGRPLVLLAGLGQTAHI